jgi:ParB family chromosome partitioning protein
VLDVPISLVRPSPWQPRRAFDEDALAELADSIRAHGIIQPLVCRRQDGFYELIGGERRLRAASLAGLTSVPVVTADAGDREAAELALVENLQREDLNPIEEAEGYKALAENFKLTQADIAERVGKARASVANALRLLDLPDEVRRMVGEGLLSGGHAKALLAMPGEGERIELARQCLGEGLSVRALERRVARKLEAPSKRPAPRPDVPEDWLRTLTDKIRTRLATPVRLFPSTTYANGRHGRGHLEIDFFDNDDLTRLLELLGVDVNEP